jgi:PAS domain S-box-containing protein
MSDKFQTSDHAPASALTTTGLPTPEEPRGRAGLSSAGEVAWLEQGGAILDAQGAIINTNYALQNWLGIRNENLLGQNFQEILAAKFPDSRAALAAFFTHIEPFDILDLQLAHSHSPHQLRLEIARHAGGAYVRLHSLLPAVKELAESGVWDVGWATDREKEMYLRLMRAETQMDNLLHRWPGVIFSQRPDYSFSFVSPRVEEMTGVPAKKWMNQANLFWQTVHEQDMESVQQRLKEVAQSGTGLTSSYRIRHAKTGRVIYLWEHRQAVRSRSVLLLGFEGIWLDISRQAIAEKRLSTVGWKESLGVLTYGLAHDFSNIIAGIMSLSETYHAQVDKDHPFAEGLSLIMKNAMQAHQLVQRMRKLHQGKAGEKMYHDLNEVVPDMLDLMRKVIPRRVEVVVNLLPGQLPVFLDGFELRQVIANLTLNAIDAMSDGGRLVFSTARHTEPDAKGYVQGKLPRLPAVSLTVRDSGIGIPGSHLASIFDPFFTTKPVNKGSGLGLYNARLFAEKYLGAIEVESQEKVGTAFSLWMPEADFSEAEQKTGRVALRRHTVLVAGLAGTALDSTVSYLREQGYYVATARSESEAMEFLSSPDYQFSGVIFSAAAGLGFARSLLERMRKEKIAVKTILHLAGINEDEIQTDFLLQVDLVINQDQALSEALGRLKEILDQNITPNL